MSHTLPRLLWYIPNPIPPSCLVLSLRQVGICFRVRLHLDPLQVRLEDVAQPSILQGLENQELKGILPKEFLQNSFMTLPLSNQPR